MVAVEELERKEQELKAQLEIADSLAERKQLRLELREVRQQIFDYPTTKDTATKEKNILNTTKNEKNDFVKKTDTSISKKSEIIESKRIAKNKESVLPDQNNETSITDCNNNIETEKNSEQDMSVTIRARIHSNTSSEADTNNNSVNTATDSNDAVLKSAEARAERRARRAAHLKALAAEKGSIETSTNLASQDDTTASSKGTVHKQVSEERKEEIKSPTFVVSTPPKTSDDTQKSEVTNSSRSPGLTRASTWSTNRTAKSPFTLKKFQPPAGPSPFNFGISYLKKKDEEEKPKHVEEKKFSFNKYTPTVAPPKQELRSLASTPAKLYSIERQSGKVHAPSESVMNNGYPQRKSSWNKYNTAVLTNNANRIKRENSTEDTSAHQEIGIRHSPKDRSLSTTEKSVYSRSSSSDYSTSKTKPQTSSFNKYNQSIFENRKKFENTSHEKNLLSSGLRRAVSMKAAPTYLRGFKGQEQPSINKTQVQASARNVITQTQNQKTVSQSTASTNVVQQVQEPARNSPQTNHLSINQTNGLRSTSPRTSPRSSPRSSPRMARKNEAESTAPDLKRQSVADRMAFFRQAQEQEKKDIEKRKAQEEQRKRLSSVETTQPKVEEVKKEEPKPIEQKKEEPKKEEPAKKPEEEKPDSEKKHAAPCMKKREKKKPVRRTMSIGSIVLDWVQEMIRDYPVEVKNFSGSWNDGMAFCALIHKFNPDAFDFNELKPENKRHNFDLAFKTGLECKNIPILLDTEDMVAMARPEPRSVQTYIQWIWSVYGPTSGYGPTPKEIQSASLS